MPKYKIPMRRISNYIVEVEADNLDEAINKSWDEFNNTVKTRDPQTIQNKYIIDELVYRDNTPIKLNDEYVNLEDYGTKDYRGC